MWGLMGNNSFEFFLHRANTVRNIRELFDKFCTMNLAFSSQTHTKELMNKWTDMYLEEVVVGLALRGIQRVLLVGMSHQAEKNTCWSLLYLSNTVLVGNGGKAK